jgi:hypothetical protein
MISVFFYLPHTSHHITYSNIIHAWVIVTGGAEARGDKPDGGCDNMAR